MNRTDDSLSASPGASPPDTNPPGTSTSPGDANGVSEVASSEDSSASATPDSSGLGKVLIFTATYNERDNIEEYCDKVLGLADSHGIDLDLLVVDDNSPDGTGRSLDRRARLDSRVTPIHRPEKLGLGSAHKLAMIHAIQGKYDVLITMDADFSHDPAEIPALLDKLNACDFVTGSRYARGGRCDYGGYRMLVSKAANVASRALLGIKLHEFTTSYRAFRVSALSSLDISSIKSQGYSFFLESVFRLSRHGFRVDEHPIHFHDRQAGQSKIPKLEIFRGMTKLLTLLWARMGRKPQPAARESIEDRCYCCQTEYLVERFRPVDYQPGGDHDAGAYQCTTMEHRAKPPVVACLNCGLQYVPASAVAENLDDLYADVVDDTYLENRAGRWRTFNRAFDRLAPHLPKKPGRMLEIGAYCGLFMEVAKKRGWEVDGVEPSRWASEHARQAGHNVHSGTIDDGTFKAASDGYDAIVLWDVLEHVSDPVGLLEDANALLKSDGVLCLSTLDIDSWFPRATGRHWPWYMSMHIFYFSAQSMREVYRRAGLRMEEISTYCHYISVKYLVDKVSTLMPLGLGKLVRLLRPLAPKWLFVPFKFGDIKMYVGKKREAPMAVAAAATASPERRPAKAGESN